MSGVPIYLEATVCTNMFCKQFKSIQKNTGFFSHSLSFIESCVKSFCLHALPREDSDSSSWSLSPCPPLVPHSSPPPLGGDWRAAKGAGSPQTFCPAPSQNMPEVGPLTSRASTVCGGEARHRTQIPTGCSKGGPVSVATVPESRWCQCSEKTGKRAWLVCRGQRCAFCIKGRVVSAHISFGQEGSYTVPRWSHCSPAATPDQRGPGTAYTASAHWESSIAYIRPIQREKSQCFIWAPQWNIFPHRGHHLRSIYNTDSNKKPVIEVIKK